MSTERETIQQYAKDGRSIRIGYRLLQLQKLNRLLNENKDDLLNAVAERTSRADLGVVEKINIITPLAVLKKEYLKLNQDYKKVVLPNVVKLDQWAKGSSLIIGSEFEPLASVIIPLIYAIAAGTPAVVKVEQSRSLEKLLAKLFLQYLDNEMYVLSTENSRSLVDQGFEVVVATKPSFTGVGDRGSGANVVALLDRKSYVDAVLPQVVRWKETASGRTNSAPHVVLVHEKLFDKVFEELRKGATYKVNVLEDIVVNFPQKTAADVLYLARSTTETAIAVLQSNRINLFTYLGTESFGSYILKFAPNVKNSLINTVALTYYNDLSRSTFQDKRYVKVEKKINQRVIASLLSARASYQDTRLPSLPIEYSRNVGFFEQGLFLSLGCVGLTTVAGLSYGIYRLVTALK